MPPTLEARFADAKRSGRLVLGMFLVPGYPSWRESQQAVEIAEASGVDFIEYPVMGSGRYSDRTGRGIANALMRAQADLVQANQATRKWLDRVSIGVGVVYDGAWPEPKVWAADRSFLDHAVALILEPDFDDFDKRAKAAARWGKSLIVTVSALGSLLAPHQRLLVQRSTGFVYMSLGGRTGQRSCGISEISTRLKQIRASGCTTPVCAAFGIRDVADIIEVRRAGCEGVIIGSGAIEALEQGITTFQRWLEGIRAACSANTAESPEPNPQRA